MDRRQLVFRAVDVEELIEEDHPARAIWEFTGRMDWSRYYASIQAVEGAAGRAAWDPRLLASLWIATSTARAGYTLVLTHDREKTEETAEAVLHDYRARDIAEKLFDAFKTEDGQYRLRTANDNSVQGRFFLGFITLILRAEMEKRMRAADLHKSMTTAAVFDELGKAKSLVTRQGNRILLEVSKKQRLLLAALKFPELA